MRKRYLIGVLAVLIFVILMGFFFYTHSTKVDTFTSPVIYQNVVDANNQFSIDFYNKYKSNDGNIFFSPYSISSALAMTYEGAKGQTAKEMQIVLHLPDDKQKIRSDFISINDEINKEDKPYKLTTANALWAQKDYLFLDDYLNMVDKYYGGKVTNLDFFSDTENSRITINSWVEEKTNNKIKDLIPSGAITMETRLVLTNAIYFKANWSNQFGSEDTSEENFKLSSGENIKTSMMHQTQFFNYGETSNVQVLEMDYLGDDISMVLILPKTNLKSFENNFNKESLSQLKNDINQEKVQVSLPRFKFETKYFMEEDLTSMGMPTAFDENYADFTGMYNKKITNENLFITKVIHQAFVNVTESGTEAAAATAVIITGTTGVEVNLKPIKIFNADHPFIFIIQQKNTGNILFMGRVNNPNE